MVGVTFDSATTALATSCITQAENEVRKYLSKRFDLSTGTVFDLTSTASTPPIVETLTEMYSQGLIYFYQSRGGKESISRGEKLMKMVTDNLEKIAEYELDIVGATGAIIDDKEETGFRVLTNTDGYTETFAEDDPLNWAVDTDKLSDIESDRD